MENKVFYGEYSLKHWIELMRKGNITLPWYQRSFVWEKEQIEKLIETLDNNQFVPPVIIGAVKENGEWKNYILDGQQRLTSILFAKYNKYIDKKEYTSQKPGTKIEQIAEDVIDNEDDVTDEEIKIIRWNYKEIIKDNQINLKELGSPFYKDLLSNGKAEEFFNEHYLGFAYIKPSDDIREEDQSKFYSDVFRNINTGGTALTRLETRKSFYFLKEELKNFFAPDFLDDFKVITSSKESGLIDFIKYISILFQYEGNNSSLSGYGGRDWVKNEKYYKKYIDAVTRNDISNSLHFDLSYPAIPYKGDRIANLKESISQLEIPSSFLTIIDMDMYFFGLVNEIVCLNNRLDENRKVDLRNELNEKTDFLKGNENHKNNPLALKYLKSRISASLEIYRRYRKVEQNE